MAYTTQGLTEWATARDTALAIPPGAGHTINAANLLVRDYLTWCRPTTSDDQPVIDDAVYTQAAYWIANNITPMAEDVQAGGQVIASSSLLSASMTYADGGQARVQAREKASRTLCFEARILLGLAGLHPEQPHVVG